MERRRRPSFRQAGGMMLFAAHRTMGFYALSSSHAGYFPDAGYYRDSV